MKGIFRLVIGILCLSAGFVHADSDSSNNCHKLSVIISNTMGESCTLKNKNLYHGYFAYTSMVPAILPAHTDSQPFVLVQSIFGSDLTLTYQCGQSKLITIHTKQNACIFSAGELMGEVFSAKNMTAWSYTTVGSLIWNQHGSIHWVLESK